jgi:hypothetical protein
MKPDYSEMDCTHQHKTAETTLDRFGLSSHLSLKFLVIDWPNYFEMDCLQQHKFAEATPDCFALSCHLSLTGHTLEAIHAMDWPKDSAAAAMDLMMICLLSVNLAF